MIGEALKSRLILVTKTTTKLTSVRKIANGREVAFFDGTERSC